MTEPASSPSEPRPAKRPSSRRILRGIGFSLAGIAVILLLWSAAQVGLRRTRPAPLFSESDLPALVPPGENGWEILRNAWRSVGEPKRPEKEVAEICDAKASFEDRWSLAEGRAQKLSDVAHDASKWIVLLDKAFERPRFTDSCPIQLETNCPRGVQLLALHQIQESVVLHDAQSGRWDDAFARTVKMARTDVDFLPSGRSAIGQAVSQSNVHRTMKLVGALLDGAAKEANAGKGPDATKVASFAKEIDGHLSKIRAEDMEPMRAVVAEYLYSLSAFDFTLGPLREKYGPITTIIYDPGHSVEMLNGRFEKLAAFARAGGVGIPPEFHRSSTWFLRNPMGQRIVEAVHPGLDGRIPIIEKDRQAIVKDREALQARLAGYLKSQ